MAGVPSMRPTPACCAVLFLFVGVVGRFGFLHVGHLLFHCFHLHLELCNGLVFCCVLGHIG